MQRNHSSWTSAPSCQVLSTCSYQKAGGLGLKHQAPWLENRELVLVKVAESIYQVSKSADNWHTFNLRIIYASIYCLTEGVTGCEVSFKQFEFPLTLIHVCSVFTSERENVGYLIPHHKVVKCFWISTHAFAELLFHLQANGPINKGSYQAKNSETCSLFHFFEPTLSSLKFCFF